ncbi:hypothetical protein ATX13_09485, partial [Oenococcus oeni]
ELLKFLETKQIDSEGFFFRGENSDFKDNRLTAGLFRPILSSIEKIKKDPEGNEYRAMYYSYTSYAKASQAFYREIPDISNTVKRNFMAFCQHHGIPTPLLDVSSFPLSALYFACIGSSDNEDAFLYIFDKNNFFEINNQSLEFKDVFSTNQGFSYDPLSDLKEIIKTIYNFKFDANRKQIDYWHSLKDSIISEFNLYTKNIEKDPYRQYIEHLRQFNNFAGLIEYFVSEFKKAHPSQLFNGYMKYLRFVGVITNYDNANDKWIAGQRLIDDVLIYVFFIYLGRETFNGSQVPFYPKNIRFFTRTTSDWGRIQSQGGQFIVQNYRVNSNEILDSNPDIKIIKTKNLRIASECQPDYVIRIKSKCKKSILKELDDLNVNRKSLFQDKDSIANYVKEKYFKENLHFVNEGKDSLK